MRILNLLLLMLVLLPTPLLAKESTFEKAIARGVAAIEQEEVSTAINEFQTALSERPEEPTALLYLGIAQNMAKDPGAEETLKRALRVNPESSRTNLELGILYLRRNLVEEASDFLEAAQRSEPASKEADKAAELLQALKSRQSGDRWWVKFQTGMQYDTNVLVNATDAPLPPGFNRKSDWRGVISGSVGLKLLSEAAYDVTVAGSIYQSLHLNLDEFDLLQPGVEIMLRYRLSPSISFKAGYGYDYLLLGKESFASNHNLNFGGRYTSNAGHSTNLEYRLRSSDYKNQALFPTNSDRNGELHVVSLIQTFQLAQDILLRLGYEHEEDLSSQEYWQYSGNRGLAGITFQLPLQITADLYGEFVKRDYGAAYPPAGTIRCDTVWIGSSMLSYKLNDFISLTAGYYQAANSSNISSFDYLRGITTLFAQVRY